MENIVVMDGKEDSSQEAKFTPVPLKAILSKR